MQTTKVTVDELRPGDVIFAQHDDVETSFIHCEVLRVAIGDAHGPDVTHVRPVSHEGFSSTLRLRTGLFGDILRIDG
jgi:hypothetical protein